MRPELLGESHGKKVYFVDCPGDYEDYDDIVVERKTYKVYYRGYLIGSLAYNRKEFSRFDDGKFDRIKRNKYWAQEPEKSVKEETPAAEPKLTTVPSLLDNELKFDNSVFKAFADYIDNELKILKEKEYDN